MADLRVKKRLVVGMSGASGAQLGVEILKEMQHLPEWETHLVISEGARRTIEEETSYQAKDVEALATKTYSVKILGQYSQRYFQDRGDGCHTLQYENRGGDCFRLFR